MRPTASCQGKRSRVCSRSATGLSRYASTKASSSGPMMPWNWTKSPAAIATIVSEMTSLVVELQGGEVRGCCSVMRLLYSYTDCSQTGLNLQRQPPLPRHARRKTECGQQSVRIQRLLRDLLTG